MIIIREEKYFTLEDIREKLAEQGIYQKTTSTLIAFVARHNTNRMRIEKTREYYYPLAEVDRIIKYFVLNKKRKMLNGMIKATSEEIENLFK